MNFFRKSSSRHSDALLPLVSIEAQCSHSGIQTASRTRAGFPSVVTPSAGSINLTRTLVASVATENLRRVQRKSHPAPPEALALRLEEENRLGADVGTQLSDVLGRSWSG